MVPCCCSGGIHLTCLEKEMAASRHPGFCDTCGELFSDDRPALAASDTAGGASAGTPSRPSHRALTTMAAAGLLAIGGAVAFLSSGGRSKHSVHSSKPVRPNLLRSLVPAAAAKQAAQGKAAEQSGGRGASRRGAAASKGRSTADSMLIMSRLHCLFLGTAAALNLAEASK